MYNSAAIMGDIDSDFIIIKSESLELKNLESARNIVAQFGISSSSFLIMKSMGLLSTASFGAIAIESLTKDNDNFKNIALEELDGKISDKKAGWSAKLLSFVKSIGTKTLDILNPIWEKITTVFDKAKKFTWDKTKSVGKAVKAHPYKTIILVVLAIAAVGGILAYCGSFLPGARMGFDALGKFEDKIVSLANKAKIPWNPKGSVEYRTVSEIVTRGSHSLKVNSTTVHNLGWTQTTARTCYAELSKAMTSVKSGLGSFVSRGIKVLSEKAAVVGHATVPKIEGAFKSVGNVVYNHTGSSTVAGAAQMVAGGTFFWGVVNIFHKVWRLIKKIVIGGLKMIYSSIRNLFDFS